MKTVTKRQLIDAFIARRKVVYGGSFESLRSGEYALYDLDLYADVCRGRVWESVAWWYNPHKCVVHPSFVLTPFMQLLVAELERLGIVWDYVD